MTWTKMHGKLLCDAFEMILGEPKKGSISFVRCLAPEVVEAIAADSGFAPKGWKVWRVAEESDSQRRTITADQAVELREEKEDALLLVVDTTRAGAGMDGIYSAARDIDETTLFKEAMSKARLSVTEKISREARKFAEQAIKKARGYGQRYSIPPWTEFDFLVRVAEGAQPPGALLHLIGLWPIFTEDEGTTPTDWLDLSRSFVERLLGTAAAGQTPGQRIASLKLQPLNNDQRTGLERFLQLAGTKPRKFVFEKLAESKDLWIGNLKVASAPDAVLSLALVPWRQANGKLAKWSGLIQDNDQTDAPLVPVLELDPNADNNGNYSRLEVRWKVQPENIEKGAAEYRVAILTDLEEELTAREVSHTGNQVQKCKFSNDDFSMLSDDAMISAKIVVTVVGSDEVEPQESEEFQIRFGSTPAHEPGGLGKKFRTLSDAVIELDKREDVAALSSSLERLSVDSKGFLLMRSQQRGKNFRVYSPPLFREVEQQWGKLAGAIGRWRVRVLASGARANIAEFVPHDPPRDLASKEVWDRTVTASRRLAERFAIRGGCGQIYDQLCNPTYQLVKEYILAWAALLDKGDSSLALANTVEVQSLAGRTIGLIVLPSHPLRVAWHVAYDNLVLHAAFEQKLPPEKVREEFSVLDGAMFPAFLPGLQKDRTFLFADTLGLHSVGMVADNDEEPKASIAILARALGESESADMVPTGGRQTAHILGREILKYLDCHNQTRFLQIHALRAGDGLTVVRSLGQVQERYQQSEEKEGEDERKPDAPAFVLELYSSAEQRVVAGRFIAEAREKRRSGAGVLAVEDCWMLESLCLPGGIYLPRLRWAKKAESVPQNAAHLAIAFDTFESSVASEDGVEVSRKRPFFAYGLMSFLEREYASLPSPSWRSRVLEPTDGEKHPSDRLHTERLCKLQQIVQKCVARHLEIDGRRLILRTDISSEKAKNLRELHRLCDWVITIDRNAGIEYFDSPSDNPDIYDAYVIDCVPERQDLGCLQLITSTSKLEEVRSLLNQTLDQMGLSHSRRNAESLMGHLKALSGRLAIRLTGQRAPTSELIALALSHAHALQAKDTDPCWTSLSNGFFIPVDDVQDLVPPVKVVDGDSGLGEAGRGVRPDLIHVSVVPKKGGLLFRFIEVKYRRHLRDARNPEVLNIIRLQVESLRERWHVWYDDKDVAPSFRALRRAKLARVLRFYADKARRHANKSLGQGFSPEAYKLVVDELDRMIEKGTDYSFAVTRDCDRGWVFCPEYGGETPLELSPPEWATKVFLFGPQQLPDKSSSGNPMDEPTDDSPPPASPRYLGNSNEPKQSLEEGDANQVSSRTGETPTAEPSQRISLGIDPITNREVFWHMTIKGNPHLLIAGQPGMGKTNCLMNLCRQMMALGVRPIVFSYHEDIDQRLAESVPSVRFVDFHGLGFNPLEVVDRQSRLGYLDVAGALRDIFSAIFPELGDIQGESVRDAIKKSFIEEGWDSLDLDRDGLREPDFMRFVEILRSTPKPDAGLRSLLARLGELADYGFFARAESYESLWESQEPIVIRIHKTQNEVLQRAFAALVFYKLYKDMFRRGTQDRITHAVVFDEAHRAARLTLIPTMAKECRKYGISLVLASQEARDFNASLFSAIANYLILRVTEADAKALVRNVATSEQERAMIDKIKQIEKYKALYFTEQSKKPCLVNLQA